MNNRKKLNSWSPVMAVTSNYNDCFIKFLKAEKQKINKTIELEYISIPEWWENDNKNSKHKLSFDIYLLNLSKKEKVEFDNNLNMYIALYPYNYYIYGHTYYLFSSMLTDKDFASPF